MRPIQDDPPTTHTTRVTLAGCGWMAQCACRWERWSTVRANAQRRAAEHVAGAK